MIAGFQRDYILLWSAGMIAGFICAILVLRRRGVRGAASVAPLVAAVLGLIFGTKLHMREGLTAFVTDLLTSPGELIGPGGHFPFGLLLGALMAGLTCLVLRVPWRETGDALAVAASVMIAIGRFGCFRNGCCRGTTCGEWALALHLCVSPAHNPASLAGAQRAVALIHPLQLYFAFASFLTLGVLIWQLRRGARPGTLLATFCILRPTAKLALEQLRGAPSPDVSMTVVPAGVILVTSVVLIASRLSASRKWPRDSRAPT